MCVVDINNVDGKGNRISKNENYLLGISPQHIVSTAKRIQSQEIKLLTNLLKMQKGKSISDIYEN